MPYPNQVIETEAKFRLEPNFSVQSSQLGNSRVEPYLKNILFRLDGRTGTICSKEVNEDENATVIVNYKEVAKMELGVSESYSLVVSAEEIKIDAQTDIGATRGLETLLQLLSVNQEGYYFPGVTINDNPRFLWRGLLIDVCRHFFSEETIKRNIDAMAAMKMNVLHLHLSEDQGFRIESKVYPKLHEMGSNGNYFTQDEMKSIIAYANARGIRVIPEFDIPGHATSWLVGYPELASQPGPYEIEKKYGVMNPSIDPTKESTYVFLDKFIGEMASLFPDQYFHIGGDENNGKDWDNNPEIQAFMKVNNLKDNHALQNYFNQRLAKILTKHGKIMIGWDEILQPELPNNIVIQSWRGKAALESAAKNGYKVMLSSGYYIDLCKPASAHYLNDPLSADTELTAEEQKNVLGGEATMWAELVTEETIDSRIWPRTCAIAERFWSPQNIVDVNDMYRRLEINSFKLEELGLQHIKNQAMMMRRLVGDSEVSTLNILVDVCEPLKVYARHHQGVIYSSDMAFTRLADIAIPDPKTGRDFNFLVDSYIVNSSEEIKNELVVQLTEWSNNHTQFIALANNSPILRDALPLSKSLSECAKICLAFLTSANSSIPTEKMEQVKLSFENAKKPAMETELMVITAMEKLVQLDSK
ncbi:MAG: family 20 glycosylhydrolase [Flavobacteriales bacterium]|nr:family 20 glycosylhydrolase [Flavobacteriales bacterium]